VLVLSGGRVPRGDHRDVLFDAGAAVPASE
jgi:hypothetical protein